MKFMMALVLVGSFSTQAMAGFVGGKFNCEEDLMGSAKIEISKDLDVVAFKAPRQQKVMLECSPVYRTKRYQQSTQENIACKLPGRSKQDLPDLVLNADVLNEDYTYFTVFAGREILQLKNLSGAAIPFHCNVK